MSANSTSPFQFHKRFIEHGLAEPTKSLGFMDYSQRQTELGDAGNLHLISIAPIKVVWSTRLGLWHVRMSINNAVDVMDTSVLNISEFRL